MSYIYICYPDDGNEFTETAAGTQQHVGMEENLYHYLLNRM